MKGIDKVEFNTTGTYIEVSTFEELNNLNRGDYKYIIFDMFDEVHKRDNLVLLDLQEIEETCGIDFIYVMGKFDKRYKQCLKLTNNTLEMLQLQVA